MREYASVSPQFWIGETGKSLRGKPECQVLAMYLMTSPHANMIGVFHCPVLYMGHETGLGTEGAIKALASLIEAGFCEYEDASETVFVVRMAAHQVGEQLKREDKRVLGILKAYQNIASAHVKSRFFAIYNEAYFLPGSAKKPQKVEDLPSPLKDPPKQLTGTGTRTGVDAPSPSALSSKGSRLAKDWELPTEWKDWAQGDRADLDCQTTADTFRDYWVSKPGKDGVKLDWQATWRNWVRSQKTPSHATPKADRRSFV